MKKGVCFAFCAAAALSLAACSGITGGDATGGSSAPGYTDRMMNSMRDLFSSKTQPSLLADGETADTWCPVLQVMTGGANLRTGSGGTVSTQLTLHQFARECIRTADGTVRVKVAVLGFALLGPAGRPGVIHAPVHFVVKDRGSILTQRTSSPAVTIPPGSSRADFFVIEENIIIPKESANSFELEVGLVSGRGR